METGQASSERTKKQREREKDRERYRERGDEQGTGVKELEMNSICAIEKEGS